MKEILANLMVMDHLIECTRKDRGSIDKNECLQTICEAQMVILKNQEEILSNQKKNTFQNLAGSY